MHVRIHSFTMKKLPFISAHPTATILILLSIMSGVAIWQAATYLSDQELTADRIAGKRTTVNQEQLQTVVQTLSSYHAAPNSGGALTATFAPASVDTDQ